MKKIVTIRIEVDMENPECKNWKQPKQYFESEVTEVLEKFTAIGYREFSKYTSEEGQTESGNNFKLVLKKVK
jgi:hypothetical protein